MVALPEDTTWQPGWQTAEDLREEWYAAHGWIAEPPQQLVDEWDALQRAEENYYRGPVNDPTNAEQCTIGSDVDPVLLVPAHPQFGERRGDIAVELFQLATGQPVVIAFRSVETLVDRLGPYQPWLRLPGETVVSLSGGILLIDPDHEVVRPIWTEGRFNALKGALNDRL